MRARAHTPTQLESFDARVLSSPISLRLSPNPLLRFEGFSLLAARDWRRRVARAKGRARWRARCMTGEPRVGRAKKQVWFTKWRSISRVREHIARDIPIVFHNVETRDGKRGLILRARVRVTVVRLGIGSISRDARR